MCRIVFFCFLVTVAARLPAPAVAKERAPLTVLVMDPLALPLSCPCVKGHAQRLYDKLGAHLEKQLDRPVKVLFSDDLSKALHNQTKDVDVVIGKRSVVQFDAKISRLHVRPAMMLTGKDGKTTVTGLIVVRKDDPAKKLEDLRDYAIFFGPPDCDEKFTAAAAALKKAGISLPAKIETRPGCSDSVVEMLEHPEKPTAAVISSYAARSWKAAARSRKARFASSVKRSPCRSSRYTSRIASMKSAARRFAGLWRRSKFIPIC